MVIQGIVNPLPNQSLPDSVSPVAAILGKFGEILVNELGGKYFTQNYRQNLFHYTTPTGGVTLTTSGATTQTFGILNPPNSGKLLVPTKARIAFVGATGTVAGLVWCFKKNITGAVAGTSNFATATFVSNANNANLSAPYAAGQSNSVSRIISTCTLDAAPTLYRHTGISWGAPLATTAAIFPMLVDEFDGDTIVGPGTILFLSGDTAPGAATEISLSWLELPA